MGCLRSVLLAGVACLVGAAARAEVVTDGSLGPRVSLSGAEVEVGAGLGTTRGRNLFHSFARFGVPAGGRVTFTGPEGLKNVVSRVTGGEASRIDGTLRSTVPGADLYLVNPSGVVFGPGAALDVPASFHVSTADRLRFADGARLETGAPTTSGLTTAPPEAFGFLGAGPGLIEVDGATLQVPVTVEPAGRLSTLSLVGGEVVLRGATVLANRVVAAAQQPAGEVRLEADGPPVARDGPVTLAPRDGVRSAMLASGPAGGAIRIEGGKIVIAGSNLFDLNPGDLDSADGIAIAGRDVDLLGTAQVSTRGTGSGRAGSIGVMADAVAVDGGFILADAAGASPGGDIRIEAGTVDVAGIAAIRTAAAADADPAARGGTTTVIAKESLTVRGTSFIGSDTIGAADAGSLVIEAGRVDVLRGGTLSANALLGPGNGGSLRITAGEVLVDGGAITAGVAQGSTGRGGGVRVDAGRVVVRNVGMIESGTLSDSDGGSIDIAAGEVLVDGGTITAGSVGGGAGGDVRVRAGRVLLVNLGSIENNALGDGDAGSIAITAAELLSMQDGGNVSAFTVSPGTGAGGNVMLVAPRLEITGAALLDEGQITSGIKAFAAVGGGRGGAIAIRADEIAISDRGQINSSSFAAGAGGAIAIEAGTIVIDGRQSVPADLLTGIAAAAGEQGTGRSGNITVRADTLMIRNDAGIANSTLGAAPGGELAVEARVIELRDNGNIVASSFSTEPGAGDAGRLRVVAGDRLSIDNAFIGTESVAAGGGGIEVRAGNLLLLTDAGEISSSVFGGADTTAGDVSVRSRLVVLNRGSMIVAQATEGAGGNIRIDAGRLVTSVDSVIDASAETGISGTVVTSSPEVDLTSGLVVLPTAFLGADRLLRESCAARGGERLSSFTGVGRGGLPPGPEQPLAAGYAVGEGRAGAVVALPCPD